MIKKFFVIGLILIILINFILYAIILFIQLQILILQYNYV